MGLVCCGSGSPRVGSLGPGDCVVAAGLQNDQYLNGLRGCVLRVTTSQSTGEAAAVVVFGAAGPRLIRLPNLRVSDPPALSLGATVVVHSLEKDADLNGSQGMVREICTTKDGVPAALVDFSFSHTMKLIRLNRLTVVDFADLGESEAPSDAMEASGSGRDTLACST
eukprot:TRINITY_DN66059_c0_g1_i1.p2 TRINITY_DN66059_c0_g1~~TRINITY_DN66059_c0_g1_i1.p2  ORF type:complete len:192 (+),score=46.92 TRINITY_DN66059_c0_g1_i1:77-577(+)